MIDLSDELEGFDGKTDEESNGRDLVKRRVQHKSILLLAQVKTRGSTARPAIPSETEVHGGCSGS